MVIPLRTPNIHRKPDNQVDLIPLVRTGRDERDFLYSSNQGHARIEPIQSSLDGGTLHPTIASIADFQPHVTSGLVPPPANPLGISQPCIRLTDVAAVGRSADIYLHSR